MKLVRQLQKPQFEKVAAKILLGNDTTSYPTELLNALYRQWPFMSNYQVDTVIKGQEPNAGYMYGAFVLRPQATSPEMMGEQATSIRIPIIVQARKAYSFDVLIDAEGKFYPVSESRVSKLLFDPSPVAAVSPKSVSGTTTDRFSSADSVTGAPPSSRFGSSDDGPAKFSSALGMILPNTPAEVVNDFVSLVEGNATVQEYLATMPSFADAVERVLSMQGQLAFRKEAEAKLGYEGLENAPVIVLVKKASGYDALYATRDRTGDVLRSVPINRAEAEAVDLEFRQRALADGFAVLSTQRTEPLAIVDPNEGLDKAASIEAPGVYAVISTDGDASRAVVLTKVARLDGTPTSMKLIVGAAGVCYQEKVAGIYCDKVDTGRLTQHAPSGNGFFVLPDGSATELVNVGTVVTDSDGFANIMCDTVTGPKNLKLASVNRPAAFSDCDVLFPDTAIFVPATEAKTPFQEDGRMAVKLASADAVHKSASLKWNSETSEFCFRFPDSVKPIFVKEAHIAAVMLGLQGDCADGIYQKLGMAALGGTVMYSPRPVDMPEVSLRPSLCKEAAAEINSSLKEFDIVKIAAAMVDPNAVDTVLSLGFVTDENLLNFVDMSPQLEETVSSLAQMLVAARLGAPDLQEQAIAQALVAVEKTILGLKRLHIRLSLSPMGDPSQTA